MVPSMTCVLFEQLQASLYAVYGTRTNLVSEFRLVYAALAAKKQGAPQLKVKVLPTTIAS